MAINRTADMHVQEKSDYAVVPMNQPNKEGQPSAEVGEGRAWTVENVAKSNTSPTQSGERVSHGLGDVREAAQERGYTLILLRASPSLIHGKSRMRRRARTDLCGGRSVMAVPTATVMDLAEWSAVPSDNRN